MRSPEFLGTLHESLLERILNGQGVPTTLALALRDKIWEGRIDRFGRSWEHPSFLAYLNAKHPAGLGYTLEEVRPLIVTDLEVLAMFDAEVQRSPGAPAGNRNAAKAKEADPKTTVDNVHDCPAAPERPAGNSKQAGMRRLRKDRPDLLERVIAGELSVNAACIEAGWRKQPSKLERLKRLWALLSDDERRELREWFSEYTKKGRVTK